MREWFESQLAAGLPAFSGSHAAGTLAVTPALVNELIATWLTGPRSSVASRPAGAPLDLERARTALKSVAVRAEAGRILIDFEIRV